MRRTKKWLVLLNRFTLVVKNRAPRAHPTRVRLFLNEFSRGIPLQGSISIPRRCQPLFCLHLGLNLPPKAIGIEKTVLNFALFSRRQISRVGFPYQGVDHDRLPSL